MTYIAMHNTHGNSYRYFSTAIEAIAYASQQGSDWAVHAPAGNIIWRSQYTY